MKQYTKFNQQMLDEELSQEQSDYKQSVSGGRLHSVNQSEESFVDITINSSPVAADVEVNGEFIGSACENMSLPSGVHTVRISLPGYGIWEKQLLLRQGMKIHAKLHKSADFRFINE